MYFREAERGGEELSWDTGALLDGSRPRKRSAIKAADFWASPNLEQQERDVL